MLYLALCYTLSCALYKIYMTNFTINILFYFGVKKNICRIMEKYEEIRYNFICKYSGIRYDNDIYSIFIEWMIKQKDL